MIDPAASSFLHRTGVTSTRSRPSHHAGSRCCPHGACGESCLDRRSPFKLRLRMEAVSVLHVVGALLIGLLVLRGGLAVLHHYWPDSGATIAATFIVG